MVGQHEFIGEQIDPGETGGVHLNTFYETRKLPIWLITLKLSGVGLMISVGLFLAIPALPLPVWQSVVLAAGLMLLYVGFAFFVRPEPNGGNMGFLGGFFNDPTRFSDNINRMLWKAHCCLGPGRFIAETILDCCTLVGLTAEVSADQERAEQAENRRRAKCIEVDRWRDGAIEDVRKRQADLPSGQVELSSARFFDVDPFDTSVEQTFSESK